MPELPDLEVLKGKLKEKIVGRTIKKVSVKRPVIIRMPLTGNFSDYLVGNSFKEIERRGKNLIFYLNSPHRLVFNLMLVGRLQHCQSRERLKGDTCAIFSFDNGYDLRYIDSKTMGKIYLVKDNDFSLIPSLQDLGPEPLSPEFTLEAFKARLRGNRRQLKALLTDKSFISGIGNAYSDEILFEARLHPQRLGASLRESEIASLYEAIQKVLREAIKEIEERIGEDIHIEHRQFFKVHGKKRMPCPKCSSKVAEIKIGDHLTNFCPQCQPGTTRKSIYHDIKLFE